LDGAPHTDDEPPELAFFCPDCDAKDFGDRLKVTGSGSSTPSSLASSRSWLSDPDGR
jgi:hypothetical protein